MRSVSPGIRDGLQLDESLPEVTHSRVSSEKRLSSPDPTQRIPGKAGFQNPGLIVELLKLSSVLLILFAEGFGLGITRHLSWRHIPPDFRPR